MRSALITFTAACLALLGVVYAIGFGTSGGIEFDRVTFAIHEATRNLPALRAAAAGVTQTLDVASALVLGGGIVGIALLRDRQDLAVAVVVLVVTAFVTTQLLKVAFRLADPFGTDAARLYHGSFPSGHATIAMSVALALVLVVPPALKTPAALLGGLYAAAMGISLLEQRWHYASDVAGGFLVAGAWAGAIAAARPMPATGASREAIRVGVRVAAALLAVFGVVVAVAVVRHPGMTARIEHHTQFFVAAGGFTVLAVAIAGGFAAVLQARR